jgi:hypothetical protein
LGNAQEVQIDQQAKKTKPVTTGKNSRKAKRKKGITLLSLTKQHYRDIHDNGSWSHSYNKHGGEFDLPIHHFQQTILISSTTPIKSELLFSKISNNW